MEKFYVYIYFNPLNKGVFNYGSYTFEYEPFYIGKGTKYRAYNHLRDCFYEGKKANYNGYFYKKLRKFLNNQQPPIIQIFSNNLSEEDAFLLEKELILSIGRKMLNEGPLCNNTEGGDGASGAVAPRYKVSVFNNEGDLISVESSVKVCSEKYSIPEAFIYKQIVGVRSLSKNGLRFKKFINKEEKLCKEKEVKTGKRGTYKIHGGKSKRVYQYDLNNNLIDEFINAQDASEKLGILRSSINNNLLGRSKTCNKYKFKYKKLCQQE